MTDNKDKAAKYQSAPETKTDAEKLADVREALNNIIVAIRGGGNLNPAADEAQAVLDATAEVKKEEVKPKKEAIKAE